MAEMHDDEPQPAIALSISRVCCPLHGEPFREEWPKGWMPFSLMLLRAALATPTLIDEAEQDVNLINGALDRTPLCERVEPEVLMEAYTDCGLGRMARCDNCGVPRQGVVMLLTQPGNVVPTRLDHVCFDCIVTRLRPTT